MIQKRLAREFPVVWDRDPALDRDRPDFPELWEKYRSSRDISLLPVKHGDKLAVFTCRPLTMGGYNRMLGELTQLGQCSEAVRYGLKKITGMEVDGMAMELSSADFERDGRDERVKSETLNKIFDPSLFAAIGLAVIEESQLDPTRARV